MVFNTVSKRFPSAISTRFFNATSMWFPNTVFRQFFNATFMWFSNAVPTRFSQRRSHTVFQRTFKWFPNAVPTQFRSHVDYKSEITRRTPIFGRWLRPVLGCSVSRKTSKPFDVRRDLVSSIVFFSPYGLSWLFPGGTPHS